MNNGQVCHWFGKASSYSFSEVLFVKSKKTKGKQGNTGKRITPEIYELLLESYRVAHENVAAAARAADCTRRTAKRAWETGWDYDWAPPIKDVIEQEQIMARARVEEEEERPPEPTEAPASSTRDQYLAAQEDRARAKEHAIRARAEEGRMIEGARKSVMQVEGANLKLGKGIQLLAARVAKALEEMAELKGKRFNLADGIAILKSYSTMVRDAAQSAKVAVDMERLHLGEATQIIGTPTNFDDADEATLLHELRKGIEVMEAAAEDAANEEAPPEAVQH